MKKTSVATFRDKGLDYCYQTPFNPPNPVYSAVSKLLADYGLDSSNFLEKNWNPFRGLIFPGNRVTIKPNFVTSQDREKKLSGKYLFCSLTHPSVIRPVIDLVWRALEGEGEIFVVDSPIEGCNFQGCVQKLGIPQMINYLQNEKKINVKLIDLRDFRIIPYMLFDNLKIAGHSVNLGILLRRLLPGDPKGYVVADLKDKSYFNENFQNHERLRFHRSNPKAPIPHHTVTKNEYSISKTVLESDMVINIAKLKTHKKMGVTLALKSVIGLTNNKYWLPHYKAGYPPRGDEFSKRPSLKEHIISRLSRFPLPFGNSLIINVPSVNKRKEFIEDGCWAGNDTLWRTILDLNLILYYADKDGFLQSTIQRKFFHIIDGVIAGEGEGPLSPQPKHCGVLLAGEDPVAVDMVATNIMGFDIVKIPYLRNALSRRFPLGICNLNDVDIQPNEMKNLKLKFTPPYTWEDIVL